MRYITPFFAIAFVATTAFSAPSASNNIIQVDNDIEVISKVILINLKEKGYPKTQILKHVPLDPWNHFYHYVYPGVHNPQSFDIYSLGPDGVLSADDIGNWGKGNSAEQGAAANP